MCRLRSIFSRLAPSAARERREEEAAERRASTVQLKRELASRREEMARNLPKESSTRTRLLDKARLLRGEADEAERQMSILTDASEVMGGRR